jgi:hypothetical protein
MAAIVQAKTRSLSSMYDTLWHHPYGARRHGDPPNTLCMRPYHIAYALHNYDDDH